MTKLYLYIFFKAIAKINGESDGSLFEVHQTSADCAEGELVYEYLGVSAHEYVTHTTMKRRSPMGASFC